MTVLVAGIDSSTQSCKVVIREAGRGVLVRVGRADRIPRTRVSRRARDATAGLTVTRLANGIGTITFAGTTYTAGRRWARTPSTSPSSPGRSRYPKTARSPGSTPSATTGPANSAPSPTPKAAPRLKNSATGNVA